MSDIWCPNMTFVLSKDKGTNLYAKEKGRQQTNHPQSRFV